MGRRSRRTGVGEKKEGQEPGGAPPHEGERRNEKGSVGGKQSAVAEGRPQFKGTGGRTPLDRSCRIQRDSRVNGQKQGSSTRRVCDIDTDGQRGS